MQNEDENYLKELESLIESLKENLLKNKKEIKELKPILNNKITCEINNKRFNIPNSLLKNSNLIKDILMCGDKHFNLNINPFLFELVIIMEEIISKESNFIYSDIPKFKDYNELVPLKQYKQYFNSKEEINNSENKLFIDFIENIKNLRILIDFTEILNYLQHIQVNCIINQLALKLSKLPDNEIKEIFFDPVKKTKNGLKRDLSFLLNDKL